MTITIGLLAKQAEVTIETIRHYQRIGLLHEPDKPGRGYRCYPPDAVARIRFIKRAQQAGFTLKEVAQLLSLDAGHCAEARSIAEQKCQQIDAQIKDLMALRHTLQVLVKACQSDASAGHCPLIDALSTARDGGSVAISTELMRPTARDGGSVAISMELMRPTARDGGSVAIDMAQ